MTATKVHAPLKKHIWGLIILNLVDGLLTYMGLSFGVITERNPLLASLSPVALLMMKTLLSLCLFSFLFTSLVNVQSCIWRYTLIFVNGLYVSILFLHFYWLIFFLT